jgi:serine/threonine protein phosphatase PrpC
VWLKKENYPGLAMSRSIGDLCATSVGVTPTPGIKYLIYLEIFEYNIENDFKFMVIASDGVWEFLSNKQICDLVEPFYKINNHVGASEKLIDESYKKWRLQGGLTVDDITCIVIFFNKS